MSARIARELADQVALAHVSVCGLAGWRDAHRGPSLAEKIEEKILEAHAEGKAEGAREEREACAYIADLYVVDGFPDVPGSGTRAARLIAADIRARKEPA